MIVRPRRYCSHGRLSREQGASQFKRMARTAAVMSRPVLTTLDTVLNRIRGTASLALTAAYLVEGVRVTTTVVLLRPHSDADPDSCSDLGTPPPANKQTAEAACSQPRCSQRVPALHRPCGGIATVGRANSILVVLADPCLSLTSLWFSLSAAQRGPGDARHADGQPSERRPPGLQPVPAAAAAVPRRRPH